MGDPAADAALYRFYADMLDTYGEHWPDRLVENLRFDEDEDASPIELPPPVTDPDDMLVVLMLRVPLPAFRRLKVRAESVGSSVDDFVVAQALAAADTPG
ncbi:hypothetical protein [Nocardia sp. NPDC127526]|uniref:hypothetical protein n=1 Tax=Nocardia sp. NPDC127526 TaxID=3345393 RepID=UPI003634142E